MNKNYWIFTFGCGKDIYGDMAGKAIKIFADSYEEARKKMWARYGSKWGFQYSSEEWSDIENDPNRYWNMEEIVMVIS